MPTDPDDDNDDDDGLLLEEQPAPLPRRIPGQKLDRQGTYTPYHGFSMVYPLRGTGTAPPEDGMLRSRPHKWLPTHPADEAWSALPALASLMRRRPSSSCGTFDTHAIRGSSSTRSGPSAEPAM